MKKFLDVFAFVWLVKLFLFIGATLIWGLFTLNPIALGSTGVVAFMAITLWAHERIKL